VYREDLLAHRERIYPSILSSDHWDTTYTQFVIQYWPAASMSDYFKHHLKIDLLNISTTTDYKLRAGYVKYRLLPR